MQTGRSGLANVCSKRASSRASSCCRPFPPSAATGLTTQSLGDKQVALSWQPATDPSGVGYLVKRGTKILARVFTTTYVDRPSNTGTYYYSVVAFDAYGNNVTTTKVAGISAW